MVLVEVNNSICKIVGLTLEQHKSLSKILSYTDDPQASYFSGGFNRRRYLIDKKGNFPSGLLYLVKKYLIDNKIQSKIIDKRIVPKKQSGLLTLSLDKVPYKEQIEAAKIAALSGQGIIEMPTGCGKSFVVALIINELKVPTLIVVPSLELKRQLEDTLSILYTPECVGQDKPIWVENVQALDPDYKITNYDCVIVDEVHHSGAKTYRQLNKKAWTDIYYKFGLTATFFRSKENEKLLLESVLSKIIYKVEFSTAVQKKYITPVESYFVEIPSKKSVSGYSWAEVYSELVVNNKQRNFIISFLLNNLKESKLPTLCLVKEIKHGDILSTLTGIPFANGINEDSKNLIDKFNSGRIPCLIGTTGVLGEGVDTKPCEYVIIAGLGKSKGQFMQQVGRSLRIHNEKESGKIIIFKDKSHKWTLNHFNQQVKFLKQEYGSIPVKLDIIE